MALTRIRPIYRANLVSPQAQRERQGEPDLNLRFETPVPGEEEMGADGLLHRVPLVVGAPPHSNVTHFFTGRGASCKFFAINGVGYKLYGSKQWRDWCVKLQRKAAEHGLGPQVWSVFDDAKLARAQAEWPHGYATELADLSQCRQVDTQELARALKQAGLPDAHDLHFGNVGHIDGREVCIDFSHFAGSPCR